VLAVRDAAKELLTQGGGATVAALQQRAIEAHVSDD
jgi:hypothetical protein